MSVKYFKYIKFCERVIIFCEIEMNKKERESAVVEFCFYETRLFFSLSCVHFIVSEILKSYSRMKPWSYKIGVCFITMSKSSTDVS